MSLQALRYALGAKVESTSERIVLVDYADHAGDDGYAWPSLERMAKRWHTHPARLRNAREALIRRGQLFRTKERRGDTKQLRVYRMPECTYERGRSGPPSEGETKQAISRRKPGDKQAIRQYRSPTNLEPRTRNHKPKEAVAVAVQRDNSIVSDNALPNAPGSFSVFEGDQEQRPAPPPATAAPGPLVPVVEAVLASISRKHPGDHLARDHPSTPAALSSDGELWWELHGKYHTQKQAKQLDHELYAKLRPVLRRADGTFIPISLAEAMKLRERG